MKKTNEIININEFSKLEKVVSSSENFLNKISNAYFKPKSFEKWGNGKVYEILGIKQVKKVVVGTIGKYFKQFNENLYLKEPEDKDGYFIRKPDLDSLKSFERGTRVNEKIHNLGIGVGSLGLATSLYLDLPEGVLVSGTFLLLNSYLTMLQRYNRTKVQKLIDKKQNRDY